MRPPQPQPQQDHTDKTAATLREREQLQQAMANRPVIDMARGVLVAGYALQPEDAWDILVTVSQHANVKLREVAEAIVATTTGQPMPESLRKHLTTAVQARQTP
ncbi:ANTAR domain-containing protein [Streptomyces sp. NPDC059900]|uniref:ANTAR domain-containing protein n=1 Tax=Streptomyces sp. NPDC059900 TaxID=3155816 RepID=UPI003444B8F7